MWRWRGGPWESKKNGLAGAIGHEGRRGDLNRDDWFLGEPRTTEPSSQQANDPTPRPLHTTPSQEASSRCTVHRSSKRNMPERFGLFLIVW